MKWFGVVLMIASLSAQSTKLHSSQVVDVVRNAAKRQSDKDLAEYLKKVTLTDRLTDDEIEACIQAGAGARTVAALKVLAEKSAGLAEAPKVAVVQAPKPVGRAAPSKEEKDRVLARVTEYARGYVSGLPNFTCTQTTDRFEDPTNQEQYKKYDQIVETLSYSGGQEQYTVLMQNGKLVQGKNHMDLGGTTTSGEFGTDMKLIFEPVSGTDFEWESWTTWHGRLTHKFFYRVTQALSHWQIEYQKTESITAGYKGYIYVDAEMGMIMRVTREAEEIPASFPVQRVRQSTEYEFVKLGDGSQEYLLPSKSEIASISGRVMVKNELRFGHFRRFGADVKFIPTDEK